MNIAFYISGRGTRVCEILSEDRKKELIPDVKFVLSDSWKDGELIREICEQTKIQYIFYDYKNQYEQSSRLERNEKLSDKILSYLEKENVDYLFVFGHHLLSGKLLKKYENRIIGFHPSILPSYTGFNAIDQAIANKEFVVGNTAFFIDEGMDTGLIIMQSVMLSSNFGTNNYEALLHPLVDMFYKIWMAAKEKRIHIQDKKVVIDGANYHKAHYYPEL